METPILMFTAKTQMEDKVIGFEVGANDYLTKPTHPSELQARVKALLARANEKKGSKGSAHEAGNGFVIGVISARGGLGATTVALNVAAGLHLRTKSEVIVAELLPGRGALALELGVTGTRGQVDLLGATKLSDITRDSLRESVHHDSGLALLLASDRPRDMHLINQIANYVEITSGIAKLARFVVLDLGAGLQPFTEKVLAHCHEMLVVLEGNPNTIINTKSLIDDLAACGVNHQHFISAVLNNRIRSDTQLPSSQVQSRLNHEILTHSPPPLNCLCKPRDCKPLPSCASLKA